VVPTAPATVPVDTGGKKEVPGGGKKKEGPNDEESNLGRPAPATLVLNVPADAKLTIDGYVTKSTSPQRRFITPPLETGREYTYTLKAEVTNDGKTEVVTQRVAVRAGQVTNATITLPVSTASAR
jgi:uncharacterized protein (TIGR03000 family)